MDEEVRSSVLLVVYSCSLYVGKKLPLEVLVFCFPHNKPVTVAYTDSCDTGEGGCTQDLGFSTARLSFVRGCPSASLARYLAAACTCRRQQHHFYPLADTNIAQNYTFYRGARPGVVKPALFQFFCIFRFVHMEPPVLSETIIRPLFYPMLKIMGDKGYSACYDSPCYPGIRC